jgi:inward rectifier potassium channel
VLFSRGAVVTRFEGVPSLLFLMANARANQVAEAQLRLSMVRDEVTAEGDTVRRQLDLTLRRSRTPVFALTWTAVHPITPDSPLHGETAESMGRRDADLVVSFTGYDESFSQTILTRHVYRPEDLAWGFRFRDMFTRLPDGRRAIDYQVFDELVPAPERAEGEPAPAAWAHTPLAP